MTGKKVYLQPMDMVLNAIHNLEELQKGKLTVCDAAGGIVNFQITMYASVWDYRFTVTDIGGNRCGVKIEVAQDTPRKERLIENEFALLDYALLGRAKIELEEIREFDRQFLTSRVNSADWEKRSNEGRDEHG